MTLFRFERIRDEPVIGWRLSIGLPGWRVLEISRGRRA